MVRKRPPARPRNYTSAYNQPPHHNKRVHLPPPFKHQSNIITKMENLREAVSAGSEGVKQSASHARYHSLPSLFFLLPSRLPHPLLSYTHNSISYEGHKAEVKDPNLSVGTRTGAAIDAVGDKLQEASHAAKKEGHKQKAIH